ncbi:MAG TPA: formimidoylglutamate deiminase [Nocardioidaceae bacterium]|nr:formimidoylglutamate deiminase [Nocardioidaceae bacterium]
MSETYWLERAWLGPGEASTADGVATRVLVTIEGGRFAEVTPGVAEPPSGAHRLEGLTIPGMANCHSHAFHRALRGRTQRERGTFWTWREQMYALAGRLTPDTYFDLAKAAFREMVAAGFTAVGEFHYLHHGPGGTPYDDPNAMGQAVVDAAREAGLRITLLDTCYVTSRIGAPAEGVQLRFSDGDAEGWAARVERLETLRDDDVLIGAAVHSVRAVPREQVAQVADWVTAHRVPLHVHLSEQVAENEACLEAYGMTPTELLDDAGALGSLTTAVHATHLTVLDVERLGGTGTHACFCPTTERDLGDGIGPSRQLYAAGARLTLGTDSHAVVDPFEEMRAVELDERLATQERGHWSAEELLTAATVTGHRSLGFEEGGRIAVGAPADLVTLGLRSPRTAGTGGAAESAVFAAGAADVTQVVAGGRVVATAEDRAEIGCELDSVISRLWEEVR